MRLFLALVLTAFPSSLGFSTGGGATGSEQTCQVYDLCPHDYAGRPQCPGMLLVGGPTRSGLEPGKGKLSPRDPTYTIRTADVSSGGSADPSADTMTFSPGSLVKIYVRVNKRFVKRRRVDEGIAGLCICFHNKQLDYPTPCDTSAAGESRYYPGGWAYQHMFPNPWAATCNGQPTPPHWNVYATAKYLGFLLYAEDESGNKIGSFELNPARIPRRFYLPPDPGCDGKAVMHAGANPKKTVETFSWRAPTNLPIGSKVFFRCLVKQDITNFGAFFWPLAPAMNRSWDDLTLTQTGPRQPTWFAQTNELAESCNTICSQHTSVSTGLPLSCNQAKLDETSSGGVDALSDSIKHDITCVPPLLRSCGVDAPFIASSGVRVCHFHGNDCGGGGGASCSATGTSSANFRLCPCT